MTCIVGLVTESGVLMGSDSAAVSGWEVRATRTAKLFRKGEFLIGYTTSFRMGQMIRYQSNFELQGDESDEEYMVCKFIETVRSVFNEFGFMKTDDGREEGGTFLVGYRGHLYEVHSDLQAIELEDGMGACGCGKGFALGAMKALENVVPAERITKALETAAYFSGGVMRPFHVMELPNA
jgi:ATP-dependent protease HslVU (ClpYQ) peptidase subunit